MKCAVLNVRATFGMITRKWKSAMLTVIGPPLVNTMTMKRRTKSNTERKGSFSPSPFFREIFRRFTSKQKRKWGLTLCVAYGII